jgi:hypothetical protein
LLFKDTVINPSFYNDVFKNIILESFSERKFMLDIITDEKFGVTLEHVNSALEHTVLLL